MIQIADRLVDYNDNFQLYLFSSNADLTLSSDQSVLLTIVNFTLNHIGLTEQVRLTIIIILHIPSGDARNYFQGELMRGQHILRQAQ